MTAKTTTLVRAGLAAAAAAILAAGCGKSGNEPEKSEAERFGYKGEDLTFDTNLTYLVVGPDTTNWVPERVIIVYEDYDFSDAEKGVLEEAGTLIPAQSYKDAFPEGYRLETKEPWFQVWNRPAERFGLKGVTGVMTHFNEETGEFETSETYFSSYWQNRDETLVALAKIRKVIEEKYPPLRFHDFEGCWVAEYRRLFVMGVSGQKPDGTWTCMFDLRDKKLPGCGPWEPVDEQQERLEYHEYTKAMRFWREETKRIIAANREAVAKAIEERGIPGFPEAHTFERRDGRTAHVTGGQLPYLKDGDDILEAAKRWWKDRAEAAKTALGVDFGEAPAASTNEDGYVLMHVDAENEVYKASLSVEAYPPPRICEGPDGPGPDSECGQNSWRIVYEEKFLDGLVLPVRPQPPRRRD